MWISILSDLIAFLEIKKSITLSFPYFHWIHTSLQFIKFDFMHWKIFFHAKGNLFPFKLKDQILSHDEFKFIFLQKCFSKRFLRRFWKFPIRVFLIKQNSDSSCHKLLCWVWRFNEVLFQFFMHILLKVFIQVHFWRTLSIRIYCLSSFE